MSPVDTPEAVEEMAAGCEYYAAGEAAAIVAFLRALPAHLNLKPDRISPHHAGMSGFDRLAAAVERAAGGGG